MYAIDVQVCRFQMLKELHTGKVLKIPLVRHAPAQANAWPFKFISLAQTPTKEPIINSMLDIDVVSFINLKVDKERR